MKHATHGPCQTCGQVHQHHPDRGYRAPDGHAYRPGPAVMNYNEAKPTVTIRAGYRSALFGAMWACLRCGAVVDHDLLDVHDGTHG